MLAATQRRHPFHLDWPNVSKRLPVIEQELATVSSSSTLGKAVYVAAKATALQLQQFASICGIEPEIRSEGEIPKRVLVLL